MFNTIKKINMQNIYEELCNKTKANKEMQKHFEILCTGIEEMPEFNSLFFFSDKENYEYYYQMIEEQKIKDFLSNYIDVSLLDEDIFIEYRKELCELYGGSSYEIGKITIEESDLYECLHDEFLNEEEYVNRLVTAKENFFSELNKIKRECFEYLVDMAITEARQELMVFEFED